MAVAISKICDPAFFRLEDAIECAKTSIREIPGFELHLVRYLQTICAARHVPLPAVFRCLEVLGGLMSSGTVDEARLIPMLRPFLRSGDAQIASKCVLVLGRESRNLGWLSGAMAETDERIRANLIESLWGRREPQVEQILGNALSDPHPRVVANAVHGLYLFGSDAWTRGLEGLLGHDRPDFRKSGIWVLKSSGIPDAPARLQILIRDADPGVRHAAFDALIHLRGPGTKPGAKPGANQASPDPALPSIS